MSEQSLTEYPKDNFFTEYFNYLGYPHNTEASAVIHRWCSVSLVSALLGRNFMLYHGHFDIFPNQYIQIIGVPATRKSTAIKIAKKLLEKSGYTNFASEKTRQEKFLMDLHDITWGPEDQLDETSGEIELEKSIFGTNNPKEAATSMPIAEMYIACDEFIDFIGRNNLDFISLLGTLWDYSGVYSNRLKHSKPVYINNPTINIIAGNTYEGFHSAFPPEIQGQGFCSRLLFIHAEPTGRKVTIPDRPSDDAVNSMINSINRMKLTCVGVAALSPEVTELLDTIYKTWKPIDDPRFAHYTGRRLTHLLKLSLVCAAARYSKHITVADVLMANTLLTYAEFSMPKAMGQFGKGKNSAVTHKIMELINGSDHPVTMAEIIRHVHSDVDNLANINDLITGLKVADKIQIIEGGKFLPKKLVIPFSDSHLVKPTWLLPEEVK